MIQAFRITLELVKLIFVPREHLKCTSSYSAERLQEDILWHMLACFDEVFCVSCTGVDVRDLKAPSACESYRLVYHCSLKAVLAMPRSGPKKWRGKTRQLAKSSLKQRVQSIGKPNDK